MQRLSASNNAQVFEASKKVNEKNKTKPRELRN